MSKALEVEIAWAAGFYDGEGSTWLHREKTIRIGIGHVRLEPLQRFKEAVGSVNRIYGPYAPNSPTNRLPYYTWRQTGKNADATIALLWPYLSAPKREQVENARAKIKHLQPRCQHGTLWDSECPECSFVLAQSTKDQG